jgi:hypothetical protein
VLHYMIQTLEYAACQILLPNHDDTFRHWQTQSSSFQVTRPANTGMAYDVPPPSAVRSFHPTTRFFSE